MKTIINNAETSVAALGVTGVDYGYPGRPVFHDLTLSLPVGVLTAVTGPNGCGKSTLLGLLAGVLRPGRGRVDTPAHVAFAVQRCQVIDTFPVTAAEAVMMGRWRRLGLLRRPGRADRDAVAHWLTEFGLDAVRDRPLGELSGGQHQRVLLAQAFVQQAPVLLLDEPSTGLDAPGAVLVTAHLRCLTGAGTTVVAATHDDSVIRAADHRVALPH